MHSRIFMVSRNTKEQLVKSDEEGIFDGEMQGNADYVVYSDLLEDKDWLSDLQLKEEMGTDEDNVEEKIPVLKIENADKFIAQAEEDILKKVEAKYQKFMINPNTMNAFQLANVARTKYERHFIIYDQNKEFDTHCVNSFEFADFLRTHPSDTFYIYQSFDYHF